MREHTVYALFDPRDPEAVRYIGYSHDPAGRLWSHLWEAKNTQTNTRKLQWIRSLLAVGVEPCYRALCIVESKVLASQREIELIAEHFDAGFDLTNGTEGGDGGSMIWTPELLEQRSKLSSEYWSGHEARESQRKAMNEFWASAKAEAQRQKNSEFTKQQLQDPNYTGGPRTAEAREKMRLAKLGKPHARQRTPEWNAKIAAAQKGIKRGTWTEERKAAHKARMSDPETKAKMSASAKARQR